MTSERALALVAEQQISDATRLKRVVALFQRELGSVFGNAMVRRRNHRYVIQVAVYEKPLPGKGRSYRMSSRQLTAWIKHAADRAHPRLYRRTQVSLGSWQPGKFTGKLLCPVTILVDADQ